MNRWQRFKCWLDDWGAIFGVCLGVVTFVGFVIFMAVYLDSERSQRPNYDAWQRLYQRPDLSLADWNRLRAEHLLPNQLPVPPRQTAENP